MIQNVFKQIANQERGGYSFQNKTIRLGEGVRGEEVTHNLNFDYKGCLFTVLYRIGVSNSALVSCQLHSCIEAIPFEISTTSHLLNLILRREDRVFVKSRNTEFKNRILNLKSYKELVEITNEVNFCPSIFCGAKSS